jgi:alanine-alpha-ketoisovalerate/valine-pyruvate aminotransferase
VPGEHYFAPLIAAASRSCLRLSFGVQSEVGIRVGIERLAHAIKLSWA